MVEHGLRHHPDCLPHRLYHRAGRLRAAHRPHGDAPGALLQRLLLLGGGQLDRAGARHLGVSAGFRFLLGLGESANWPGATKAVSEWFPDRERAWAVALFDSGSSVGGVIAPFLVVWLYHTFGTWRPAFLVTGCLGFMWLLVWRAFHIRRRSTRCITPEELSLSRRPLFEEHRRERRGVRGANCCGTGRRGES